VSQLKNRLNEQYAANNVVNGLLSVDDDYRLIENAINVCCKSINAIKESKIVYKPLNRPTWFDSECIVAEKKMKRCLRHFRNNREISLIQILTSKYVEAQSKYKQLCNEKSNQYNKNIELALTNHKNSKEFWQSIKSLRSSDKMDSTVEATEWFQHYSTIYKKQSTRDVAITQAGIETDAILDRDLNPYELMLQIKKLKRKKAPGLDFFSLMKCGKLQHLHCWDLFVIYSKDVYMRKKFH